MLPSLSAHPKVELVAAADTNPDARARFVADYGGVTFESIEALCAGDTVDAVYIATPHQLHAPNTIAAARHKKHVLVEKPMALGVEECRAMVEAADEHGVVLIVGHTHAFDPAIIRMREVIESGELGRLRMITSIAYTDFLYRPRRAEELDSSLGGGIMYNQVPHQIEIARALDGGPVRGMRAITGVWDAERPTEGALAAMLEFEDGVIASFVYSGYDRFDTNELHGWISESGLEEGGGTHGGARRALRGVTREHETQLKAQSGFSGRGVRKVALGTGHQQHFGFLLVSCEGGDMRPSADGVLVYGAEGEREESLPAARAYPNKDEVINELYDAVARGVKPRHDGRWGLATVEVMLGLVRSSQERRELVLKDGQYAYA
jgi:phthalate 4,5-cis-dihydrodiol dehydrogenase